MLPCHVVKEVATFDIDKGILRTYNAYHNTIEGAELCIINKELTIISDSYRRDLSINIVEIAVCDIHF